MSILRNPARAGLSYFDANLGRLVTEGPDVCDFKSRLRELGSPGELDAYYDVVEKRWIVTAKHVLTGTEYFVLADADLGKAYERVQKARNDAPGAETADQFSARLEREQDEAKDAEMDVFREISGDMAERLIHAFKKDGIHDHENIYGPKPRKWAARRDVRVRASQRD